MGEDRPRSLWGRFSPLIVLTAEISSVLAFLGVVVSLALNSIMFTRWGLRFIDIANPSDILLSGVALAGVIVAHAAAYLIVALPFALALRFLPRRGARHVLRAILTLCAAYVFYRLYRDLTAAESGFSVIGRDSGPVYVAIALSLAALYVALRRDFGDWLLAVQGLIAALALFVPIAATVYDGALGTSLYAVSSNPDLCPRPLSVKWIGTSALVARCEDLHGAWAGPEGIVVLDRAATQIMTEDAVAETRAAALARSARSYDPRAARDWRRLELVYRTEEASRAPSPWTVYVDRRSLSRQGTLVEAWLLADRRRADSGDLGTVYILDVVAQCDTLVTNQFAETRAAYQLGSAVYFARDALRNDERRDGTHFPWQGDVSWALCGQSPDVGDPPGGELAEQLRYEQARFTAQP